MRSALPDHRSCENSQGWSYLQSRYRNPAANMHTSDVNSRSAMRAPQNRKSPHPAVDAIVAIDELAAGAALTIPKR